MTVSLGRVRHGRWPLLTGAALVAWIAGTTVAAQRGTGAGAPAPPASPRSSAPIDLTGYWVAVVSEDWRWRMVTPPKGDFASVPLNAAGLKVGREWNPADDGSCLAFGAAGLMRMPTRLHITWENESTLTIETDAGQQTRKLLFGRKQSVPAERTLQGHSVAEWENIGGRPGAGRGGAPAAPRSGNLKVTTTHLNGGWLRRNGAPYSQDATLTEYFDRFAAPDGTEWLVVMSIVTDPQYLTADFVTSSHFKREPDGAKWSPAPCREG
jgi:hypothetical protein